MKIGRQDQHSSAICTSNEETIVVRGRDLARELIGHVDFTEHFWLLLTGALPSAAQRRMLMPRWWRLPSTAWCRACRRPA